MSKTTDLLLISGKNNQVATSSTSTYFFHVTVTGAEEYMKTAPVKPIRSRNNNGTIRSFEVEYEVLRPFRIKMVCVQSAMGKKKLWSNVVIDVDPDAPIIELQGLAGFGLFKGGGILVPDMSSISLDQIKEWHKLRVLSLSKVPVACGTFTRRIIV